MKQNLKLTSPQRKELRAQAHHLDPVVMIGSDGLTPAVTKETDAALNAHGLIKIRVLGDEREERIQIAEQLCQDLEAALIQHIGKLLVLYRPLPPKGEKIDESRKPGPRIEKIVKPPRMGQRRPTVSRVRVFGNERVTEGGMVKRKRSTQKSSKKA
ncbi:MAG: ribosome assembly RNA-binding protein YhbY [Saezia sp.]